MGDLSPHFSRKEFECRCCGRLKLDQRLLEGLDTLRQLAGVPVIIHAGFRCPEPNQEVGGVPHSEHSTLADWRPTLSCLVCHDSGCTNLLARSRSSQAEESAYTTATSCMSICETTGHAGHGLAASM